MTCYATTRLSVQRAPALIAGASLLILLAGCARQDAAAVASASRWQPASDDTIILELPAATAASQSLYDLRQELLAETADPIRAARYASAALQGYQRSGDPRLLGYANGALSEWRDTRMPPLQIWLLRARLLQTEHQFELAAREADALLKAYPRHTEALLLSADAWRRAGNLAAARGRCLSLSLNGRAALASLCAADIQLSLGRAAPAMETAAASIADISAGLSGEELAWANAILAEAATASGSFEVALDSWERALGATEQPPLALRLGLVDTLLEAQRFTAALDYLDSLPAVDAVLLRRAIAGTALEHRDLAKWRHTLQQRFADPVYADDSSLHWRERALYELHVTGDADAALEYAQRNWQVQKGFEDADLLLRAAAAARKAAAADAVTEWRRREGTTS